MKNPQTSLLQRLIQRLLEALGLANGDVHLASNVATTTIQGKLGVPTTRSQRLPKPSTTNLAADSFASNLTDTVSDNSDSNLAPELTPIHTDKIYLEWKPLLPIDAHFFDWLMGYPGIGSSSEIEQKVLQALYGLLASDLNDAVIVPRVPTVIPQLLSSLRSGTASAAELSRHIVKDVVLVNEVISAVNSALYNPSTRVNSLEKAVMILGEDGLRLVIAKVAFRPIINLNAGQYTRRAAPHIWAQTEKTAIACHQLAPHFGLDPFSVFLTALMKNIGLIIAFRLLDQVATEPKFIYSRSFHQAFTSVAATISYRVAQRWGFPDAAVVALQQQAGGSKAIAWTALGHLLHTSDLMSKMRLLANHAQLRSNDDKLTYGLEPVVAQCYRVLNEIPLFDPEALQKRAEAQLTN